MSSIVYIFPGFLCSTSGATTMLLPIHCYVLLLSCLCSLTTVVSARSRGRSPYAIKEAHHVPRGWSQVGDAPAWHMIRLQIGLKQSQFSELERQLFEGTNFARRCPQLRDTKLSRLTLVSVVSDPMHFRYGQHLTRDEVNQLVKPTSETIDEVHQWLSDNDISYGHLHHSPAKDWISFTLPVKSAERLLDTKFSVFKHEDGSHLVRTQQWSLPSHLHSHVQTIQPTTSFFSPRPKRSTLKTASLNGTYEQLQVGAVRPPDGITSPKTCNVSAVTSLCLRTLYGKCDLGPTILSSLTRVQALLNTMSSPKVRTSLVSQTISGKRTIDQTYFSSSTSIDPKHQQLRTTSASK